MNNKKHKLNNKTFKICFISTYPPHICGIATYTQSLVDAIKKNFNNIQSNIIAIKFNNLENYEKNVSFVIGKNNKNDYLKAAQYINNSDMDIVNLQHEFGIFGGFNGKNILYLVEKIKKPLIITLHSVPILHKKNKLYSSRKYQSKVVLLKKILKNAEGVIIMSESTKKIVKNNLRFDKKTIVLHHGAPSFEKQEIGKYQEYKNDLGFKAGDFIISTFGLISPRKGLQFVIKALPSIIKNNPDIIVKYLIAGRMHPTESKNYLLNLKKLVENLDIQENVVFDSNYLPIDKIYQYLANTDIFITPYYQGLANLASSGTFSYALALGCCIVSTPYIYAQEIISKNKIGRLIDFGDYKSIEKTINYLIKHPDIIKNYQKNSYQLSKEFSWENVAKKYLDFFRIFI